MRVQIDGVNNLAATMQVHQHLDQLPAFKNSVITIGTFDGVHTGHQKIIKAIKKEAAAIGGETVLITFHPHPRKVLSNEGSLKLINTLEEKIELLRKQEIDHLVIVPFTKEFADQPAEEYIETFLINKFNPHTIVIGYDHRFGKNREGDFILLENNAAKYNYKLIEIPKHVLNEIDISSTKIRKSILDSDIETANELLGYDFFFSGKVVHGDQLGRTLGYPTANLEYTDPNKIHLGNGVYAVHVLVEGETKKGMMNIGTRPTIDSFIEKVEVNIFDFDKEIYGQQIKVSVKKLLRGQVKFSGLEALKEQLAKDKEESLKWLAEA